VTLHSVIIQYAPFLTFWQLLSLQLLAAFFRSSVGLPTAIMVKTSARKSPNNVRNGHAIFHNEEYETAVRTARGDLFADFRIFISTLYSGVKQAEMQEYSAGPSGLECRRLFWYTLLYYVR
jgi:hypothetical protein